MAGLDAGRQAAEQDRGDRAGGQRGRLGGNVKPGDHRALRPAGQQAGGRQGRDQRRVHQVTLLTGLGRLGLVHHRQRAGQLDAADGYGEHSRDLIQKVPRRSLKGIAKITVGMRLNAQTEEGPRAVTVTAVTGDMVTIVVNEQASAVSTGQTKTSRASSANAAINSVAGPLATAGRLAENRGPGERGRRRVAGIPSAAVGSPGPAHNIDGCGNVRFYW